MIGSVGQGNSTPKITLSEFATSKELLEKELDARVKSKFSCRRLGSDSCCSLAFILSAWLLLISSGSHLELD